MSLDQDKSFYCVVDGMVQVFAETGQSTEVQQGLWDHEDMNGYQLLNEVGSGGTLSSLFTILSLFTEDVKMSWQDDTPDILDDFDLRGYHPQQLNLGVKSSGYSGQSSASVASTIHPSGLLSPRSGSMSPISHAETSIHATPSINRPGPVRVSSVHRGIVARATEDTTLAVIPAEAFRRLTKNFPKATSHIVQGIH